MATIPKFLRPRVLQPKSGWLWAVAFATGALLATPVCAATVTWDASGSNPANPTDGGGTWSTGAANWSNGVSDGTWTGSGNNAIIGNANGAAGTITLGSAITVGNITFNPAGSGYYTIAGGAFTATLTTTSAITANTNATISAKLAGTNIGLTETGSGTLTLSGNNSFTGSVTVNGGNLIISGSNNYTGNTNINNGGTVQLNFTGANTGAAWLSSSSPVAFNNGGTFSVLGTNLVGQTTSQTVSGVVLNSGANSISDTTGSATLSSTLALGAITRSAGSTVNFTLPSTGSITTSTTATGGGVLVDGNDVAYATVGGTNWATVSGGNIASVTGVTGNANYTSGNNVNVTNGDSVSGVTVNTLNFKSGSTETLTLASTNTVTTGGILTTAGTTASIAGTDTLKSGSGKELVIIDNGALTIGAGTTIADSASGASALTVSGSGTTTLGNASNTYTGLTYINGTTLNIAGDASLGTAPGSAVANQLTIDGGGVLQLGGAITLAANRGITINGSGGIDTQNFSVSAPDVISGSGTFFKNGTGTLTLSGSNAFTGPIVINGGDLAFSALSSLNLPGSGSKLFTIMGGATFEYDGTTTFNGTAHIAFALGTGTETITGSGTITPSNTTATAYVGSGSRTLVLAGTASIADSYEQSLADSGGATSLTINTPGGTWTFGQALTAASTYSGYTTITTGRLLLGASNDLPTTGTVLMNETTGSAAILDLHGNSQTIATVQDTGSANGTAVIENVNNTGTASTLTVSSGSFSGKIKDAGSNNNVTLVKTGPGTLTLTGSNTFTGNVSINGGTLQAANSTALGFGGAMDLNGALGTATVSGGTLDLDASTTETINKQIILNGGNLINSGASTATIQNGIAGIIFGATNTGSYTGTPTGSVNNAGSGGSNLAFTPGLTTGTITSITTTNAGSGYTSAPTVSINGTGGTGWTGTAVLSSLGLTGASNNIGGTGSVTINAVISDSGSPGGFAKIGTDTVTLNGANTYTGPTGVNGGVLSIVGSLSTGTVTVGGANATSAPTLWGTGTITGPVIVSSNGGTGYAGTITPGVGSAVGTLHVGSLTFQTGSDFLDNVSGATLGELVINGSATVNSGALFSVSAALTTGTYTVATDTGGWSGTNGGFTLAGANLSGWSLVASGNNLILEQAPTATTGTYTLTETVASGLLHVGATTTSTTTLANTGTGTADSLSYNGLGATASTGSITGSTGTGTPVNQANSVAVTQTYTAVTAGADTVTGTATSVVGVNSTGTATLASNTSASVFVYSGAGVWTTNGGGTWGTTETTTPANWQANGGIPGITPGFTTTDSALFGTALTSGSATVTLSGASPFLNNITFADTNANTSYTIAQGSSGIIHLDSTGTATITNSNGNNTISAPVEFDSAVAASVATSDTLTLSGNISQTGTQSLAISGPGTTILSGSNSYSGGTTINSGSTFITNTSGSALGTGSLTVTAGSTFGGSGSATGLSSYTIGAVSSPATTLQVGSGADVTSNLTLAATGASSIKNTNLEFNLNTTGASNKLVIGTTALTLTGDTLTLNVSSIGVIAANTPYILVAGTGGNGNGLLTGSQYSGLTGGGTAANGYELVNGLTLDFTGIGAPANWYNNSYVFLVNNGGVDDIEVEVVPEPSAWAMMIGGLATLVFWQRRKRSKR